MSATLAPQTRPHRQHDPRVETIEFLSKELRGRDEEVQRLEMELAAQRIINANLAQSYITARDGELRLTADLAHIHMVLARLVKPHQYSDTIPNSRVTDSHLDAYENWQDGQAVSVQPLKGLH